MREPGERWACEACGTALVGARSKNGGVAPITVESHGNGNVVLHKRAGEVHAWVLGGETLQKARENGVELRLNHFAECEFAKRFEKR